MSRPSQYSFNLLAAIFFVLKYTAGDTYEALPCFLGFCNESLFASSLHLSSSSPVADPALGKVHLLERACPSCAKTGEFLPSETHPNALRYDRQNVKKMHRKRNSNMTSLCIYTEKQAYATGEDITFQAMTEEPDPLEFHWYFGDRTAVSTSRTFIKKYLHPDRYNITVSLSSSRGSVESDIYNVVIQRAVRLNRLLYNRSVLQNTSVPFSCRINAGTGVTYLWDFGDGTRRAGQDTEHHVFNSTGEYTVEVTVSNLVSSTSLKGYVFVVTEPCQPPPVKTMGPSKIQVWRYQPVFLGVTYEEQIQCNISKGLHYNWRLYGPTGLQLLTTGIKTNQQHLELSEYLLYYGTYRAVAKVRIVGTIVYSTYSVLIKVMPSRLVSIISGGTNVLINHHNSNTNISLDGRRSYDPDFPDNILSYRWKCSPVNTAKSSCFSKDVFTSSAMLTFPSSTLNPSCDVFKFTLNVKSGDRSSSSEMFVTMISKPTSTVHVSCKECRGNAVNWNEMFSVIATCESCPVNVTYFWKLYLVNPSSKSTQDVPFCGSLDISLPSKLEEEQIASSVSPSIINKKDNFNPVETKTTHGSALSWPRLEHRSMEHQNIPLMELLSETDSASAEIGSGVVNEMDFALFHRPVATKDKNPDKKGFRDEYPDEHGYQDYEDFYSGVEEADSGVSVGRPNGPHNLDDLVFHSNEFDGDNLIGPGSHGHVVSEETLLDLYRELIQPEFFESFTSTGISSSLVTFKPMMLKPKSLYMLEVSANSKQVLQGKTQLFFSTHPAPEGMACHVQPSSGYEVHTHFSIFCTSGKEDLLYDYSFSVGKSRKKRLYKGRDYQHYFYLPSGDPYDDYKVTIYISVWNRFGASTQPCLVNVKVWPSFKTNLVTLANPDQELYMYGLSNLTNLIIMQNTQDIINYIFLLTATLKRMGLEPESDVKQQTQTRSALISAVCQLDATDKELLFDILDTLEDLMKDSNHVTFDSALLVTKYIQTSKSGLVDVWVLKSFTRILSYILEAQIPSSRLTLDVLHTTTDSVLMYLLSSKEPQFSVNSTIINLQAWQNSDLLIKTHVDLVTFYISHLPVIKHTSKNYDEKFCFITVITSYMQNPYHWARTPLQVSGHVGDMKLFNCSTKREIKMRRISTPLIIEFQKQEETNSTGFVEFTLSRSEVNTHQFNITAEHLRTALEISVEFRRPSRRAFPILLLFRMHQKPTPSLYNVRKVYYWKGQGAQIFLPPSSLKDAGIAYLMILNADYDKSARNKYISDKVDYTLRVESTQCLVWDGVKEWRSDGCSVLQSFTSTKVNCSCNQLSSFTVANQMVQSIHSVTDIIEYISVRTNPMVCIVIVMLVAFYAVLLVFCHHADVHVENNLGTFLLPDNNPSDQFFYAVTIDTGLRSRAKMTAKVHIILYGEKGVSQTRELINPDHTFFTCNSRTTFILSSVQSLGNIWQVCVWHDGGGLSPSWFLNHVLVKDIVGGSSWTFLANCWLAVDEGDGQVERKLLAFDQLPTFKELLHLNLSDCLKDLHPWLTVYSRPSYSAHTHTQRLSVCFLLLLTYMCANCVFIHFQEDQCWLESGLTGVSLLSVWTGLCALTMLPLTSLVSFLFRMSTPCNNGSHSGDQYKVRMPDIIPVEDQDAFRLWDSVSEQNISWNRFTSWKNKCEDLKDDDSQSRVYSKRAESSKPTDSMTCIKIIEENIPVNSFSKSSVLRRSRTLQACCYYGTWALWLCLSVTCLIITGILGLRFSCTKGVLWIHSTFFSLLFCAFAAHPAMVFIVAVFVTLRHQDKGYNCPNPAVDEPIIELPKNNRHTGACVKQQSSSYHYTEEISMNFEKMLAARQRARYLRLARPPTSRELKSVRSQIKKRTHLQKTIRRLVLYPFALFIVGFLVCGKSFSTSNDQFHLNQAIKACFTGNPSIQKLENWWNWTANTLLHIVYPYSHNYNGLKQNVKRLSLIGEPVIMKMEHTQNTSCQSSPGALTSIFSVFTEPHRCAKLEMCYSGAGFNVPLGKNRSEASRTLKKLWTSGWMSSSTYSVMLQFTLYSPVYNLYSTVTLLGETSCTRAVLSSVFIYSTRLHHTASVLDYCTTAGELLLLLLTLLQLYFQTYVIAQRGWCYWTDLCNWIKMIAVLLSLLCFVCSVHHFMLILGTMEHLQREDFKTFVDISPAAIWEQRTCSLYGLLMLILLIKCCSVLRLNDVITTAVSTLIVIFCSLLWPLMTGLILVFGFSLLGNLLTMQKSMYSIATQGFGIGYLGELHKNQASWMLCCYGALICVVSFAVKAIVACALSSAVKRAKYKRRKHHVSVSEICAYIRDVALALFGKSKPKWIFHTNSNNFVLEEFEDLVDELLLKLNVICSSDEDQDNYKDQGPILSACEFSSEADDENTMEEIEIKPSGRCELLDPHEESSLRSLLEWNTLQPLRQGGEAISDWEFYAERKDHQNIFSSTLKMLKDSQTSLSTNLNISVHTEGSERPKATRSLPIEFISPAGKLTNHSAHRKSCRQFCLYESHVEEQEKQAEAETVNIPGQCC